VASIYNNNKKLITFSIGATDKSVSMRLATKRKPFIVIKELFQGQITDMTWTSNGLFYAFCSTDGSVIIICFGKEELISLMRCVKTSSSVNKISYRLNSSEHTKLDKRDQMKLKNIIRKNNYENVQSRISTNVYHKSGKISKKVNSSSIYEQTIENLKTYLANSNLMGKEKLLNFSSLKISSQSYKIQEGARICFAEDTIEIKKQSISPNIITVQATNKGNFSRIKTKDTASNESKWEINISSRCTAVTGNSELVIIGTENNGIYVLSSITGKRLIPPMYVCGTPTILSINPNGSKLLCLTNHGKISVWDLHRIRLVIKCKINSLLGSFDSGESVVRVYISRDERLVLVTSRLHSYIYIPAMAGWFEVDDDYIF
jgi:hypothetical protein